MSKITFTTDLCKGCGLCVAACPKGLLYIDADRINLKGYNYASISDEEACVSCSSCALMCPDSVIKIEK